MAEKLDVSSSFLSAVENGKRDIPESWYEKMVDLYNLNEEKQDELKQAIEKSKERLNEKIKDI